MPKTSTEPPDIQQFADAALGLVRPELVPHPCSTAALFGHRDAEAAFLESVVRGREQHGLILHGPKGIGKATFAYRIARFLIAHGARSSDSLDIDKADEPGILARVREGTEQRLRVLQRELQKSRSDATAEKLSPNIAIDNVREAIKFLQLTPVADSWRVLIVDAAEDLSESGSNALLKSLEEPPSQTMILLVTHSPDILLPTIMSRCKKLAMRPLGIDDLRQATRMAAQSTLHAAAAQALADYRAGQKKKSNRSACKNDDATTPLPTTEAIVQTLCDNKKCEFWHAVDNNDSDFWQFGGGSVGRTLNFAFMASHVRKTIEAVLHDLGGLNHHLQEVAAGRAEIRWQAFVKRPQLNALTESIKGTDLKQEQMRDLTVDMIERRLAHIARDHSVGTTAATQSDETNGANDRLHAFLAHIWATAAIRFRQHIDAAKRTNIDPELTLTTAVINLERSALRSIHDAVRNRNARAS